MFRTKERIISFILIIFMIFGLFPVLTLSVTAEENGDDDFDYTDVDLLYIRAMLPYREYRDGDTLDLSELVVTGYYSDGSEKELTEYTVNLPHGTVLHCLDNDITLQIVFIYYEEKQYAFDIWIEILPNYQQTFIQTFTQTQMETILKDAGNNIVFDMHNYASVDIYVDSSCFKDIDKTITIVTAKGSCEVKTKSLWNNSGKQRLITVRNGKLDFKNV